MRPFDVLHKRVVSGSGEVIGLVVSLVLDGHGNAKALRVLEPGDHPRVRLVEAEHILLVAADEVRLKGPRQGYHITRLTRG